MSVNADKPHLWKPDIAQSVDFYNSWFMQFAPTAYRDTRIATTISVESALARTANLTNITPAVLRQHPEVLPILRMATAPPIARDRLIGLAGVPPNLVKNMEEKQRIPSRMSSTLVDAELHKISQIIARLADKDIFSWLDTGQEPTDTQVHRAATIVADRLCGALADPIVRNAQERRHLATIRQWLEQRGYSYIRGGAGLSFETMQPGTFSFRLNIPVSLQGGIKQVNIPIDTVVRSLSDSEALQLALIENLQREDLNPIEQTEGILQLLSLKLGRAVPEVVSLLYRMQNAVAGKVTDNVISNTKFLNACYR
ncbi:XamI family restriction endonuclease [Coleofasciculus sp. FACHB-129]|uniref:XamI family restriction endonuclease n=1 Tax=Cyanophyceae TaxID=3028117 RepID=UPI0032208D88